MGNRPRMKPGKNEIIRRTDALLQEVRKLNNWIDYTHRLVTEYISWKKDEDKFKEHLKEIVNADEEESRELHKSSGTNNDTGKGESGTKEGKKRPVSTHRNTTKRSKIKDTGESGNIGV